MIFNQKDVVVFLNLPGQQIVSPLREIPNRHTLHPLDKTQSFYKQLLRSYYVQPVVLRKRTRYRPCPQRAHSQTAIDMH